MAPVLPRSTTLPFRDLGCGTRRTVFRSAFPQLSPISVLNSDSVKEISVEAGSANPNQEMKMGIYGIGGQHGMTPISVVLSPNRLYPLLGCPLILAPASSVSRSSKGPCRRIGRGRHGLVGLEKTQITGFPESTIFGFAFLANPT